MPSDALPDDLQTLKAMLLAERVQNERLRQIIKELQRHRFGRRAETLPEDQMLLGLEDVEQVEADHAAQTEGSSPGDRQARAHKRRVNRGALPGVAQVVIAGALPGQPYRNLGRAWIITRKIAGLDDVRLHDLRHSYASLAAGRGVSLQMIGKLLGHKVAATTMRYSHLARDQVASINDELGAAMTAAIENRPARNVANVVKLKRKHKP